MNDTPRTSGTPTSTFDRLIRSKVLWTAWALVPVAAVAWAFGPGQSAIDRDRAARLIDTARAAEARAEMTQAAAHEANRAAVAARKTAERTHAASDFAAAEAARQAEDAAYTAAAQAWKEVAAPLSEARTLLERANDTKAVNDVRLVRAKALIRGGELLEGVVELESMLESIPEGAEHSEFAEQVRHELGSGLYFGARLLRHAGASPEDWGAVATAARRQFRYLAETTQPGEGTDSERFDEHQFNVEVALDLEQQSYEELLGKPLPKNCPGCCTCKNQCQGLAGHCKGGKKKSKTKRPPGDSRNKGAGNNEFGEGW